MRRLLLFFLLPFFLERSHADFIGKTPQWDDTALSTPPARPTEKSPAGETPEPDEQLPVGPGGPGVPLPFVSMANALLFIHRQEGLNRTGLPALFWVPEHVVLEDPLENLLVHEGVGLYDTSLAILVLIDAGSLDEAGRLLDFYIQGHYAPDAAAAMDLRAAPSRYNNGAFTPFDDNVFYYFDFTNVYGDWLRWGERWEFWAAHTGPNAWLANAALHYVLALRKSGASPKKQAPYIALAETIGQAMQRLQDKKAQGGIRYGPEQVWHPAGTSDPNFEINSENNVSAYAVFRLLAAVTGKRDYRESADHILHWFTSGDVWDIQGVNHKGLRDPVAETFAMGAVYIDHRWILQPEHPTDSGGTWTLSSLGAEEIDRLWGAGAAYKMWRSIRARAGRTADFKAVSATSTLAGLDFIDSFPINAALISPEWSGGGLFALKELRAYYGQGAGRGELTTEELQGLQNDWTSMNAFIHQNPNPYAMGPGHAYPRKGATGFHWFSPPPEVHAMASLYYTLASTDQPDPLGDWRTLPPSRQN